MALKLPKKLGVSIKPVSEWSTKDLPIVKAIDAYKGGKADSRAADEARDAAAKAESEATAAAYNAERGVARAPLERIVNTTVPGVTAAALDPRFRDSQLQLLDQLSRQSQGQGPSLAQMQFKQAGNTALQKAMGAIRAATGTNAALGGRTAALASTNLLGNIAAESGMARLKEQQDAQNALAALAGAGRTGDLQARQQEIGMGATNAEIALKNLAMQQAAAGDLLTDTGRMYEGHYNRGAQVAASKQGGRGGSGGIMDALVPAVAGGVATGTAGMFAPVAAPAAGAAASGATEAAMGANLVSRPATVRDYGPAGGPMKPKSSPFMKLRR